LGEETNPVIVKLVATAKNSSVETVRESLTHLERMFSDLNERYAQHHALKENLIVLSSEYREVHGRAVRYVAEMKEFSKLAKNEYMPEFKRALNAKSLKNARRMLSSLSHHFDGVSSSFNEVATKYESTAKCIDRATLKAASLAGDAKRASESGQSISNVGWRASALGAVAGIGGGIVAGVGALVAAPVVAPALVVAGVGAAVGVGGQGGRAYGQSIKEEQVRQTAMFESFNDSMQKVNAIVMAHKVEVLDIQGSLKDLSRDNANLQRLVDEWDGDADDKKLLAKYLKLTNDHFTVLETNCDKFEKTDSNGFLRVAQALGYE